MAGRKDLVEDAATRALVAAGKDAAERAASRLLSPDGEGPGGGEREPARAPKSRRWKLIGIALLVLFVVIGVVGMLLSYWHWFLLAGVVGLAGAFGWRRIGRRLAARRTTEAPRVEAKAEAGVARVAAAAPRAASEPAESAAREAEELAVDARAREEAQAAEEQEVEDELAAMKARIKR